MCIRTTAFGIHCQTDHSRFILSEFLKYRQHIPFKIRTGPKYVTLIESQSKMMYILDGNAIMGPDQLFFIFPDHPFQQLDFWGIFGTIVTVLQYLYSIFNGRQKLFNIFQVPNAHHGSYQTVTHPTTFSFLIFGCDIIEIVINILIPFVHISFVKEIGEIYHFNLPDADQL